MTKGKTFYGYTEGEDIRKEIFLNFSSIDAIILYEQGSYVVVRGEKYYLDYFDCIRLRNELMSDETEVNNAYL